MRRRLSQGIRYGGATALVMVSAAACGSGGSSRSSSTSAAATAGLASKAPAQIVAAAQAALRSAAGFVAAGELTQGGHAVQLKIIDGGVSKLEVQIDEQGKDAAIIALSGSAYVRANDAFWRAQVGARAAALANRWIELPLAASQQLTSSLGQFAPGTLSRCLGENLGTLSRGGTTTVGGRPAVVVRQAGDAPGSNPGTLAVATQGPAYPLRLTSTGPTRPGGKVDVCNNGKGDNTEGTLTLTDFGHAPVITAPSHPIKPSGSTAAV